MHLPVVTAEVGDAWIYGVPTPMNTCPDHLLASTVLCAVALADQASHMAEQVPSDPLKCAQFRAVGRLRDECIGSGECNRSSIAMKTFDRLLVKVPEHT
eukprot:COSAG02_NODE_8388_length_2588_cov_5.222981_1_plen_99_part_00